MKTSSFTLYRTELRVAGAIERSFLVFCQAECDPYANIVSCLFIHAYLTVLASKAEADLLICCDKECVHAPVVTAAFMLHSTNA